MLKLPPMSICWFVIALLAALTAGCANPMTARAPTSFEEQSCVERALRGKADPEALAQAFDQFGRACAAGEPSACSALGVMYELGRATAPDAARAFKLYRGACKAKNIGGCFNLGLAYLNGSGVASEPRRALALLDWSCRQNHAGGCREVGKLYLAIVGGRAGATAAAQFFRSGCDLGDGAACLHLGALAEQGTSTREQPLALYSKACLRGEPEACDRMVRVR